MTSQKVYQVDYFGFVYIWRDNLKNRYYIGSHLGSISDSYIGSNKWFKSAYKQRSQSFTRRILSYLCIDHGSSRENLKSLHEMEQYWLNMISETELSSSVNVIAGTNRYYNMKKVASGGNGSANKGKKKNGSWNKGLTTNTDYRLKLNGQKISAALKGKHKSEEHKAALRGPRPHARGPRGPSGGRGQNSRSRLTVWYLIDQQGNKTVIPDIKEYSKLSGISMTNLYTLSRTGKPCSYKGPTGCTFHRC